MKVAGIGCRRGTPAADIEAVIVTACAQAGVATSELQFIATSAAKGDEPGIAAAASSLGVPLVLILQRELAAAGVRAATRSDRVIALTGVPSVAEAAALAAGGPAARLIAPRIAVGPATCALAETADVIFSPPPCGEGSGVGVVRDGAALPPTPDPPPRPSPTRGEGVAAAQLQLNLGPGLPDPSPTEPGYGEGSATQECDRSRQQPTSAEGEDRKAPAIGDSGADTEAAS